MMQPQTTSSASLELLTEEPAQEEESTLLLAHGRRLSVGSTTEGDVLRVRSREGQIELSISLGQGGAKLRFESAELELVGTRSLSLAADHVSVKSRGNLELGAAGDLRAVIGGDRHTTVRGVDRSEANTIESQANEGEIVLRARSDVRVDAEHIGLNDDPCPGPLPWTTAARTTESEA